MERRWREAPRLVRAASVEDGAAAGAAGAAGAGGAARSAGSAGGAGDGGSGEAPLHTLLGVILDLSGSMRAAAEASTRDAVRVRRGEDRRDSAAFRSLRITLQAAREECEEQGHDVRVFASTVGTRHLSVNVGGVPGAESSPPAVCDLFDLTDVTIDLVESVPGDVVSYSVDDLVKLANAFPGGKKAEFWARAHFNNADATALVKFFPSCGAARLGTRAYRRCT